MNHAMRNSFHSRHQATYGRAILTFCRPLVNTSRLQNGKCVFSTKWCLRTTSQISYSSR